MYALINTMNASSCSIGRIISQHRTAQAADAADSRLQRAVRRANGESSYLPTVIVKLAHRVQGRASINYSDGTVVDVYGEEY